MLRTEAGSALMSSVVAAVPMMPPAMILHEPMPVTTRMTSPIATAMAEVSPMLPGSSPMIMSLNVNPASRSTAITSLPAGAAFATANEVAPVKPWGKVEGSVTAHTLSPDICAGYAK